MISKIMERINFKRDRVKKGYAYSDTFDINYWFLNTIVPMLRDFNKDRLGYPCNMTNEEWGAIIDRMIYCFTEANEDTFSKKEEYLETLYKSKDKEQVLEKLSEIEKYRDDMKDEALELFRKYFWELWW